MKKLVSSKWSKRILWLSTISTFSIWGYIVLFIGTANTKIDNVCLVLCLISMIILFIRDFAVEYWNFSKGV